jgi:hypothetical protein
LVIAGGLARVRERERAGKRERENDR